MCCGYRFGKINVARRRLKLPWSDNWTCIGEDTSFPFLFFFFLPSLARLASSDDYAYKNVISHQFHERRVWSSVCVGHSRNLRLKIDDKAWPGVGHTSSDTLSLTKRSICHYETVFTRNLPTVYTRARISFKSVRHPLVRQIFLHMNLNSKREVFSATFLLT